MFLTFECLQEDNDYVVQDAWQRASVRDAEGWHG